MKKKIINKKNKTKKALLGSKKTKSVKKSAKKTDNEIKHESLKSVKEQLIQMRNDIMEGLKNQITYENTRDVGDEIDDVTQTIEKEITFDLSSNEKNILKDIEVALKKIENKTYGICDLCKKPIEPKRIKAFPYTRYCIKCQIKQDSR